MYFCGTTLSQIFQTRTNHFNDLRPTPRSQVSKIRFKLIDRWREESRRAGRVVRRVCVAFEAGRDGFWLARLLRQHAIEAYVIHPTSIPVKRDHRRAKTDRLDTALLMRAFLGWLRG